MSDDKLLRRLNEQYVKAYKQCRVFAVLAALAACSDAHEGLVETKRAGEPSVFNVFAEDAEMNIAILKARNTIGEFRDRLTKPPATQSSITLKVRFEDGDAIEHIWLEGVSLVDDQFRGVIANEPLDIGSVTLGQSVTVPLERVSDWMAIDDGRLIGGYTLRVLRNRMSPDQRAEFDASMDFRMD